MTTIVDALTAATTALNAATAEILSLQSTLTQQAQQAQTNATTVINNFLARPPVQFIWMDPVNGNDANDGSTAAKARQTLEAIITSAGISATEIYLLGDYTMQQRVPLFATLTITGVQVANTPLGYIPFTRNLSFLGTAINSPDVGGQTGPSGIYSYSPSVTTSFVQFHLPNQPAGQTYPAHFQTFAGTTYGFFSGGVFMSGGSGGSLINSTTHSVVAFEGMTLDPSTPGHLFQGIAAGANPNASFSYQSNLTSG